MMGIAGKSYSSLPRSLAAIVAGTLLLLRCTPQPLPEPLVTPAAPARTAETDSTGIKSRAAPPGVLVGKRHGKDSSRRADSSPAASKRDSARPGAFSGAMVRLYTPRSVLDFPFSRFTGTINDAGEDSSPGLLSFSQPSRTSIVVKIRPNAVNSSGAPINSLKLIDQWTRFVREHPAQGLALFSSCEGIAPFIKGSEPVIRGLIPVDNATIRIKLEKPDSDALDRVRGSAIIPPAMKAGRYVLWGRRDNEVTLNANPHAPGTRPFLEKAVIRCGGDANPLLSFSLGRYDGVALWNRDDIDYARTAPAKKDGYCVRIGGERYFIALRVRDSLLRGYIGSIVSPESILSDSKADGSVITAIETDSPGPRPAVQAAARRPAPVDSLKIYYRREDPLSKIIAERLFVSFAHAGLPTRILPQGQREFESTVAGNAPGCVVGWVDERVLRDRGERLRLAAMFFSGSADEGSRIARCIEIPLFSVNWYLLAKSKVGLLDGRIDNIYIKRDTRDTAN